MSTVTMRGISRFIAETLNDSGEFATLSNSLAGEEFTFFVNVDLAEVERMPITYFGVVTFQDFNDLEVRKGFKTQLLIGIARTEPVLINGIMEEATLDNLETLSRKAVELVRAEIRAFGIQGEKNIKVAYVSFYVPTPDGEDDLQMQVDIEFEQEKFLAC